MYKENNDRKISSFFLRKTFSFAFFLFLLVEQENKIKKEIFRFRIYSKLGNYKETRRQQCHQQGDTTNGWNGGVRVIMCVKTL